MKHIAGFFARYIADNNLESTPLEYIRAILTVLL